MAFPVDPLNARGEFQFSGVWTDVTADIFDRDRDPGVTVSRGRPDEFAQTPASTCTLTLKNTAGKYSPRNPSGTYYGSLGRNTPFRWSVTKIEDAFGRTESNGWGTADSGQAWTVAGTASEYSVGSGAASMSLADTSSARLAHIGSVSRENSVSVVTVAPGVVATGAAIDMGAVARRQDASNYYVGAVRFGTGGTATLMIAKVVAGSLTSLATGSFASYVAGTSVLVELVASDDLLQLTAWDAATTSTTASISIVDRSITAAGHAGAYALRNTGNTNGTIAVTFDNFRVDDAQHAGEVSSWPPRWDKSGNDQWEPVTSSGILRRISQGAKPLDEALHRSIMATGPVAYWRLTDGSDATQGAPAVGTVPATVNNNHGTWAGTTLPAWLGTVVGPDDTGMYDLTASGIAMGTATSWTFDHIMLSGSGCVGGVRLYGSGVQRVDWFLVYNGSTNTVTLDRLNADGATWTTLMTVSTSTPFDGRPHHFRLSTSYDSGASTVTWSVALDGATIGSGTVTSTTLWQTINRLIATSSGGTTTPQGVGYLALWAPTPASLPDADAATGYAGETAGRRIERLCAEEGFVIAPRGDLDATTVMGPQRITTLITLLQDCAAADGGVLYEPREVLGIAYRTAESLYNQSAALTLNYNSSQVAAIEPTDDDQLLRNLVVASRYDGSSATAEQTTGPLSTSAPPNGAGLYDEAISVNVQTDTQLPDVAGWEVHKGTVDEYRYPQIGMYLHGSASLIDDWVNTDIGDRLDITNPPSGLPPDTISQLIQGSSEQYRNYEWHVSVNCTPASTWTVAEADGDARVSADGSTLSAGVTSVATSLSVTFTAANGAWTTGNTSTNTTDFPFDISVKPAGAPGRGERMTVTEITGTTSPQTFTVTRSVNGVVMSHSAGAEVDVWTPAVAPY